MYRLSTQERENLVRCIANILMNKERIYNGMYVKIIGSKGTYLLALDPNGEEIKIPYREIRKII